MVESDAMDMREMLDETRFDFLSQMDKDFIVEFDDVIADRGYDFGGKIGPGYCWGNYMAIYTKTGVKSKKVYARIYMRDDGISLRLFFSNIDAHRGYIEKSPRLINEVFTGESSACNHCRNEKDGECKFRKSYTIDNRFIEKCGGNTFTFRTPAKEHIPDYIDLFSEFYPSKKGKTSGGEPRVKR